MGLPLHGRLERLVSKGATIRFAEVGRCWISSACAGVVPGR
ncbi:hypothetical protein ACIBK1_33110 [Microbispora rosea]